MRHANGQSVDENIEELCTVETDASIYDICRALSGSNTVNQTLKGKVIRTWHLHPVEVETFWLI